MLTVAMTFLGAATRVRAAAAERCTPSRLVIVLDRSSSMNGATGPLSKWEAARAAVDEVAAAYEHTLELGLALFPYPDRCGPGRLEVAPGLGQRAALATALAEPPPELGAFTPLGETLLALAADPAVTAGQAPAHVALVTDGFQWCSPFEPATRELPRTGVKALHDVGVTTYVVGFGGGVDEAELDALAVIAGTERPGCDPTGATPGAPPCHYQADDAGALLAALMDIAAVTSAETCDGEDDDCDGEIDEGACPEPGDAGPGRDAGLDAGHGSDGAPPGGCGCGAGAGAAEVAGGAAVFALALVLALRTRRRGARAPDRRRERTARPPTAPPETPGAPAGLAARSVRSARSGRSAPGR